MVAVGVEWSPSTIGSALFLARHAPPSVRVHAVPCVGGPEALLRQMRKLDAASGAVGILPEVLVPPPELITPFAAPSAAVLAAEAADDVAAEGAKTDAKMGRVRRKSKDLEDTINAVAAAAAVPEPETAKPEHLKRMDDY